jgi:hypothetical protein
MIYQFKNKSQRLIMQLCGNQCQIILCVWVSIEISCTKINKSIHQMYNVYQVGVTQD